MPKICLLCKRNEADKTGSHIVPHFLLKRIENVVGTNKRDQELGFKIDGNNVRGYFGRSVSPEKIKEIFGELSDQEIEDNKHSMVEDHVFCSVCETRLGILESIYAETLNTFAEESQYSNGLNFGLSLLFWSSIIWRLSISTSEDFHLSKNEEEILRRLLNNYLRITREEIDLSSLNNDKFTKRISYKLLRAPNFPREKGSSLAIHHSFRYPYSLLLGEYILFYSFSNNYSIYQSNNFFGLSSEITSSTINRVNNNETISVLTDADMENILNNVSDHLTKQFLNQLSTNLDQLHLLMGGRGNKMDVNLKQEIFHELSNNGKPIGKRYSFENFGTAVIKVLKSNKIITDN